MNTDYQTQSASTATMMVYQATILKQFAELEKTPNIPAFDLPGLDVVTTARGFGCQAVTTRPILRENLPLVPAAVD